MITNPLNVYNSSEYWVIEGIPIKCTGGSGEYTVGDWKEFMETWLPRYKKMGWLDGLHRIIIDPDPPSLEEKEAAYYCDGEIEINSNLTFPDGEITIVEASWEHIITHEFVHHAHFGKGDFIPGSTLSADEIGVLEAEVGEYAAKMPREAVAEIGAAIARGWEFSGKIDEIYSKFDGPTEVYEDWLAGTEH